MRERVIKVGVLTAVFILAVVFFSIITNRGNADMTADMAAPTFPTISFTAEGYPMNSLVGYRDEMNMPAMRDTITPLNMEGSVEAHINLYDQKVQSLMYEVTTLNGKDCKKKETVKQVKERMSFQIGNALEENEEGVLKIVLTMEDGTEIRYYTRVVRPKEYFIKECLDFAKELQTDMMKKTESHTLTSVIEPNEESDNTTLQHVTIHSDLRHITWGNLKPEIVGDVSWDVKEVNSTYTAVLLKYQIKCQGDLNDEEVYNVKEFFRIRYLKGKLYLLDYDRTMNQVLDTTNQILSNKGIDLGIVPKNTQYETNADGTIVSFIHERELWSYNKKEDSLALVFSFRDTEKEDPRNQYDQHAIRIISMEKDGNITFAVYGYMNRGEHEGRVGAAIYYFDLSKNAVEEKAFIPSDKSFTIAEDELGKLVYYNNEQNLLYVLVDGTLYKVNLEDGKKEAVVKKLGEKQYVASEDGHLLAYQKGGTLTEAAKIEILNFSTGKSQEVSVGDKENIRPLGFVKDDFIYGTARPEHAGKTVSGENVIPMYKLEIRDSKNKIVKTYEQENVYISDVFVESNMITLNRLTKSGEIYTVINQDYITNNEEKKESNISLQSYVTDLKETQYRIAYEDRIEDKKPKILKPKQVLFENPTTIAFEGKEEKGTYYVFGLGRMIGQYDKAGYAIQKANEVAGVVVSSRQAYVWERGNRDLQFWNREIEGFAAAAGETTLEACLRRTLAYEGKEVNVSGEMQAGKSPLTILNEYAGGEALDLTGCTAEQILYVMGKGTPVIAMTSSTNAVLLVSYDLSSVTYADPADGALHTTTKDGIDEMVAGSGHTFIGYVK